LNVVVSCVFDFDLPLEKILKLYKEDCKPMRNDTNLQRKSSAAQFQGAIFRRYLREVTRNGKLMQIYARVLFQEGLPFVTCAGSDTYEDARVAISEFYACALHAYQTPWSQIDPNRTTTTTTTSNMTTVNLQQASVDDTGKKGSADGADFFADSDDELLSVHMKQQQQGPPVAIPYNKRFRTPSESSTPADKEPAGGNLKKRKRTPRKPSARKIPTTNKRQKTKEGDEQTSNGLALERRDEGGWSCVVGGSSGSTTGSGGMAQKSCQV
jgi:hypothetical protein